MTTVNCEKCNNTKEIELPIGVSAELQPCPFCQKQFYPFGFAGVFKFVGKEKKWIVEPIGGKVE